METKEAKKKTRWIPLSGRVRLPQNEDDERGQSNKLGAQSRCHADPPPDS